MICFCCWISLGIIWLPANCPRDTPELLEVSACAFFFVFGSFTNRFFCGIWPSPNAFFALGICYVACMALFFLRICYPELEELIIFIFGIDLELVMFFLLLMCDELIFFISAGNLLFILSSLAFLLLIICPVLELALLYISCCHDSNSLMFLLGMRW